MNIKEVQAIFERNEPLPIKSRNKFWLKLTIGALIGIAVYAWVTQNSNQSLKEEGEKV